MAERERGRERVVPVVHAFRRRLVNCEHLTLEERNVRPVSQLVHHHHPYLPPPPPLFFSPLFSFIPSCQRLVFHSASY